MKKIFAELTLVAIAGLLVTALTGTAANIEFKALSGEQDFSSDASWDGDFVPSSLDLAIVNSSVSGSDFAYLAQSHEVLNISLGKAVATTGVLELRNSGALNVLGAASGATRVAYVGEAGTGELVLLAGSSLSLVQSDLRVGNNGGAVGSVTQGTDSSVGVGGHVVVGQLNNSQGSYAMNGESLSVSLFVIVGREGKGTLIQTDGDLTINRDDNLTQPAMFLGSHNTGNGYYEISGGSLTLAAARNAGLRLGTANGLARAEFRVVGSDPVITIGTGLTSNANSILGFDINSDISSVDVTGNVSLAGLLDVNFTTQPSPGDTFTLINYGGTLSGQFASFAELVDGPRGAGSIQVAIDYGTGLGSAVTITVVPEPSSFGISLLLAGIVFGARVRRHICSTK